MFEILLPISLYLVNSIASGYYVQKFLGAKYSKNISLFAWIGLYFISQSLVLEFLSDAYLYELVKVLADIAIILILQVLLYKKDLLKQFFVSVSFVAGREIIKHIIIVLNSSQYWIMGKFLSGLSYRITSIEAINMWDIILNLTTWLIIVLVYSLLMIVYLSIISKKFIRKDYKLQTHEYAFLILPNVSTLCIAITLKMLIIIVEDDMASVIFDKIPATMFWVPLICLLLLGVNISSVILFQKLVQLNEEERKRATLENQMIQMQCEIEEIQDIYADMRGLKHDMKSHLESIAAVVRGMPEGDREELDSYIGKMETTVGRLDFAYRTGNPITDVIIHQKKQEAEKRQITFEADFTYPDKQQIDVYDIGIVLNNALENAIEASSKSEGKKSVSLRSYMKGNLFFVEVENDFSGDLVIDSETGLPISNKEDRRLHGLGLENIQRCAKKYMGDIDITTCETEGQKKFILTVMMYEKYFTPKMP